MIFNSYLLKIICSEDGKNISDSIPHETTTTTTTTKQDFLINNVETSKQSCGKKNKFGPIPHIT